MVSEDNNDKHINKKNSILSIINLNVTGISSEYMCTFMRGQLFKIFIRLVFFYGAENIYFIIIISRAGEARQQL